MTNLQDCIKSRKYFIEARNCSYEKYVSPFLQRSFLLIANILAISLLLFVIMNIMSLLPNVNEVKYLITVNNSKKTSIIKPDENLDVTTGVADILIKNYVTTREAYDYFDLKRQINFLKRNSTRMVFRLFYNTININNPNSPVILYQKSIKRHVKILTIKHVSLEHMIVKFNVLAKDSAGNIKEDKIQEASINYEIGNISKAVSGSDFHFLVTDYKLKLIEDKG